jgi:hypothetical protein
MAIASAVPFSGDIRPKTDEIVPAGGGEWQCRQIDPMMDRRDVVQFRRAVGVGDGDIGRAGAGVGGQDPRSGEPVDGRHQGHAQLLGEGERQPVQMAVHQVESGRRRERVRDVQRLPDAAVHRRVVGIAVRGHAVEGRGGHGVERREEGDVDPAPDEPLGQQARDELPGPVVQRGCPPRDRPEHRDAQGGPVSSVRLLRHRAGPLR